MNLHHTDAATGSPSRAPFKYWTTREEKIVREQFPAGGISACIPLLPARSPSAIVQKAFALGINAAPKKQNPRLFYPPSPQIDEAIRRVFQGTPREGEVRDLAKTLGRPRWWISSRATVLGLKFPRFKEPPWNEDELELTVANAHKRPRVIQRLLAKRGFKRSETAILVKLKRQGCGTGRNADIDNYSATSLSKMFGVDAHVITAWVKKGWLKNAWKRGTDRTPQQGGDEYSIHRNDIRNFVIDNVAAVDFRKVDKFWLVELLSRSQMKMRMSA